MQPLKAALYELFFLLNGTVIVTKELDKIIFPSLAIYHGKLYKAVDGNLEPIERIKKFSEEAKVYYNRQPYSSIYVITLEKLTDEEIIELYFQEPKSSKPINATLGDALDSFKRLEDAIKACKNNANSIIKLPKIKKSRRKRNKTH